MVCNLYGIISDQGQIHSDNRFSNDPNSLNGIMMWFIKSANELSGFSEKDQVQIVTVAYWQKYISGIELALS